MENKSKANNIEYYIELVEANPNNIKNVPDAFKTLDMCNIALAVSSYNFRYVPDRFKTQKMCDRLIKDGSNTMSIIAYIPLEYRTQELCSEAFKKNPNTLRYIPIEFLTQEMCKEAFEYNLKNFRYVPKKFMTQDMCNKAFSHVINNFEYIPDEFKTQEMCDKAFEYNVGYFYNIPDKFKTQKMCDIIFKCNLDAFRKIPNKFKTQEMCNQVIKNWEHYIEYIPDNFKKQAYIILLKKDVYKFSKTISQTFYDEDILGTVYVQLKRLIEQGKKIPCDSNLCLYVIKLYPELEAVLDKKLTDYIKDDLYDLIATSSTAELIAEKHQVSVQSVNNVLESIKEYDIEGYKAIKRVLARNQNNYFFDIMNDVYKLGEIILSLGFVNTKFLNIEQKVKFAYLYNKHVHHSLEEIYNFNYKKYDNKYAKVLDRFFKGALKYNYLADDYTMLPEKKTILFNNSWLKKYDRDKFFGIKNGVPTIEHSFTERKNVLTQEIEQSVLNILIENDIPLNDIIVRTAFREYFNGTLNEYVTKLQGYDNIFLDNKPKKI